MTTRAVWAGRYAVFDEIASGGMATVYLACRLGPGEGPRVVAIKKLFETFAKQPEFVTMFLDEAHIAARVRHPNVVATHEFVRIPDSLGIVMELVLGVSFEGVQFIARDRGIIAPLGVTSAILCDTLHGLHAAHEATDEHGQPVALVHRDVSPHNIIVGQDGVARVIDFGIAKAAGRLQVTDVGVMKGKFAYMAPEQIRAEKVDRRVDLYSAGIVLWEALTGAPLFRGSGDATLFSKRAAGQVTVPAPSTINDSLPGGVDEVLARALAPSPDDRFATALDMAEALETALPKASPQEVSAWIHGLAGSRLRELQTKRNEVETAYATGELDELIVAAKNPRASSSDLSAHASAARRAAVPDIATDHTLPAMSSQLPAPRRPMASSPPLPELELDLPFDGPASARSKPKPQPPPPSSRSALPAMSAPTDDFGEGESSDLKIDLVPGSLAMPSSVTATRKSANGLDARRPSYAAPQRKVQEEERRGIAGRIALVLVLLLLAAGGAAFFLGPGYAKNAVIAGAQQRGVTLGVGGVEFRDGGLTLTGVTLSLLHVPELSAKAPVLELEMTLRGEVKKITFPGYELTVHGPVTEVMQHLAAWRESKRAPLAFEAKAGHVAWSDLLVPGMQLEAVEASVMFGQGADQAFSMDTPSVSLTMPRGMLGPWSAHVDSTSSETRLNVELDRATTDGPPNVLVLARPLEGLRVNATIPRAKTAHLGIPADFLHASTEPELAVELEAHLLPASTSMTGRATLSVYGLSTGANAGGPLDLVLALSIAGDPSKPMRIDQGTLGVGKVTTKIGGTVALANDGIRVEVEKPAVKGAPPAAPFVLDTRDWTTARAEPPAPKPAPASSAAAAGGHRH